LYTRTFCLTRRVPPGPVYDDLAHPPATYLGSDYSYRQPDGSHNNISDPNMGRANQPYARSVQQLRPLPQNMFPDAGLVFDTLLKREKVWPPSSSILTRPFTCIVSVRHAPSRAVQLYVFVRGARRPYVSLAFFMFDPYYY
jgi:hypothetical protein